MHDAKGRVYIHTLKKVFLQNEQEKRLGKIKEK